jgi:hypothetical protein
MSRDVFLPDSFHRVTQSIGRRVQIGVVNLFGVAGKDNLAAFADAGKNGLDDVGASRAFLPTSSALLLIWSNSSIMESGRIMRLSSKENKDSGSCRRTLVSKTYIFAMVPLPW